MCNLALYCGLGCFVYKYKSNEWEKTQCAFVKIYLNSELYIYTGLGEGEGAWKYLSWSDYCNPRNPIPTKQHLSILLWCILLLIKMLMIHKNKAFVGIISFWQYRIISQGLSKLSLCRFLAILPCDGLNLPPPPSHVKYLSHSIFIFIRPSSK